MGGPDEGDHGEAAVDDLLLESLLLVLLGQVGPAGSLPPGQYARPARAVEGLLPVGELHDADGEQGLHVRAETHGGDGLERVGRRVRGAGEVGAVLLPDHPEDREHAHAAVLQLGPARVAEIGLDVRQAHGVESHVADHRPVELLGDGEEGDGLRHRAERHGGRSLRMRNKKGGRGGGGGGEGFNMMSVPMYRAQSRDRTAKRQKWRLKRRPNSTTMLEFTPDDTHHMCGGKRGGSGQGGGEDNGLHGYGLVLGWFREGGASGWLLAEIRHVLDLLQASVLLAFFFFSSLWWLQSAIMSSPKGARGKLTICKKYYCK